ncbi:MAG TPA: M50 family metallopeptidase [Propionibacteriaceae bacterium]
MEVIAEIWRRATSVQPAPSSAVVALTALVALVLVVQPAAWRVTRMLVTITHEGGHAVAALLSGRRLQGIRLHSDTSGLTVSSGRPTGAGMIVMLLAGYLGPAVVGLGAVVALLAGRSLGLLWILTALLAVMLLQIRNFYGVLVVVGCAAALVGVSWFLPATTQSTLAYLITWILLIAAPKPVVELIRQRRRGRGARSDADQLAGLTRSPAWVWMGFFLVTNITGLLVGVALLLPALVDLARTMASSSAT